MLWLLARLGTIERVAKARAGRRGHSQTDRPILLQALRGRWSSQAVARIRAELERLQAEAGATPRSPIGKAMTDLENPWPALVVFLDNPKEELDTSGFERVIRPVSVGRRNWQVAGSPEGAATAASLLTIINTCRAQDIDPHADLADVLERVSAFAGVEALTPRAGSRRLIQSPRPDTS
jgi:hypothetical protein